MGMLAGRSPICGRPTTKMHRRSVILKGAVGKDHVQMQIECALTQSVSEIVRRLNGRTSWMLPREILRVAEALPG